MKTEQSDTPDLGPCCACGVRASTVHKTSCACPGSGRRPASDGAVAVVCDGCLESGNQPKFVCSGRPGSKARYPVEALSSERHKHNMEYHPEALQSLTWFDTSPDFGHPECVCSVCGDQILALDGDYELEPGRFPTRVYRHTEPMQEARFCADCAPLLWKWGHIVDEISR